MIEDCLAVVETVAVNAEVIVVDDGSTDATAEIADQYARRDPRVRVVRHSRKRGYGAALQTGFRAARYDPVFYTDGDGQFDVGQLAEILPVIHRCDVVSGYRLNRQDDILRKLNSWCYGRVLRVLFGLKIRDVNCAFKSTASGCCTPSL